MPDERPLIVIQARMSSSRLPGKVLADVAGEPMLALMLRRLAPAGEWAEIVVATSTERIDDPIAPVAEGIGARVVRGPRDDVLGRYLLTIGDRAGPVVRLTADCPLIDPTLVREAVALFDRTPGCAYVSNVDPRTFPKGLDVEVIDAEALRTIAAEPRTGAEREHVTAAIRDDPRRFPAASLTGDADLSGLRWTVDYPDDLAFVRAVVERLGERRHDAALGEVLAAVRQAPALRAAAS